MKRDVLRLKGFVRSVRYTAHLADELPEYDFANFDINKVEPRGKIIVPDGIVAYSKWVSPKRTRSYPFARLYDILNAPKRITVIPILKDEGADGDLDRIQYSTISWMNLLDIYIILAYYESAMRNQRRGQHEKNKISRQLFNSRFVNDQIGDMLKYKNSALHWNFNLIETSFIHIYHMALNSYEEISKRTGVLMHSKEAHQQYLRIVMEDFENFKKKSLNRSKSASLREYHTIHTNEYLSDGSKAQFNISNYLGGSYYLTVDEVIKENELYVIQESKNSTRTSLPSLDDIKDGLFKLALFSNIDALLLEDQQLRFVSRLKLTGKGIKGFINMPCEDRDLAHFIDENNFSKRNKEILYKLNKECLYNHNLQIILTSNNQ